MKPQINEKGQVLMPLSVFPRELLEKCYQDIQNKKESGKETKIGA